MTLIYPSGGSLKVTITKSEESEEKRGIGTRTHLKEGAGSRGRAQGLVCRVVGDSQSLFQVRVEFVEARVVHELVAHPWLTFLSVHDAFKKKRKAEHKV